ncbi:phage virion morphogenesis protein [Aliivibrio fischeri]|uniref:phage virion morphogenesis protein n=1 Tax=Aliivibrio fischeri TaxID=668 RepID=UPI00080E2914|nr:phage virion morphogenesis protein [Aliivibrio fischeri]OCH43712.1 virion morphogenesis protein [Aliivibrio fischeri]
MQMTNPEQLTAAINSLVMSDDKKIELNRLLANKTRQYFRGQIRKQRDIDGNPYQSRTRRKISTQYKAGDKEEIKLTQNNRNMLMGLSRALKTSVSKEDFEVGVTGVLGRIGRQHNEGQTLSFTTRMRGFYNSKTNQWEGGTKVKGNYQMPKRTFIGWTPTLERELLAMVATYFLEEETT